ncbi:MAG: methyltransferase domain-containing protein [Anaerolineae bacterium]|nr:methyltransferase domain-containing protein [Anaerolineae bacterium]NUQ05700.1 methyltransferase domain-containing protein [Anaerolineae bacterium]
MERHTNLLDNFPKTLLHFAPEPCMQSRFRKMSAIRYTTADLFRTDVTLQTDITKIRAEDNSFDVIYCSHVLEHVLEDRQALRELFRVLKPTGWALLQVPIKLESTYEDASITDPQDRLRVFGQKDHVRIYGIDFLDRVKDAGFEVRIYTAGEANPEDARAMAFASESLYYCTKT